MSRTRLILNWSLGCKTRRFSFVETLNYESRKALEQESDANWWNLMKSSQFRKINLKSLTTRKLSLISSKSKIKEGQSPLSWSWSMKTQNCRRNLQIRHLMSLTK